MSLLNFNVANPPPQIFPSYYLLYPSPRPSWAALWGPDSLAPTWCLCSLSHTSSGVVPFPSFSWHGQSPPSLSVPRQGILKIPPLSALPTIGCICQSETTRSRVPQCLTLKYADSPANNFADLQLPTSGCPMLSLICQSLHCHQQSRMGSQEGLFLGCYSFLSLLTMKWTSEC